MSTAIDSALADLNTKLNDAKSLDKDIAAHSVSPHDLIHRLLDIFRGIEPIFDLMDAEQRAAHDRLIEQIAKSDLPRQTKDALSLPLHLNSLIASLQVRTKARDEIAKAIGQLKAASVRDDLKPGLRLVVYAAEAQLAAVVAPIALFLGILEGLSRLGLPVSPSELVTSGLDIWGHDTCLTAIDLLESYIKVLQDMKATYYGP